MDNNYMIFINNINKNNKILFQIISMDNNLNNHFNNIQMEEEFFNKDYKI